jgi:hypothetical protein
MKCIECGMKISEMLEDASYEEQLCDCCFASYETDMDRLWQEFENQRKKERE